MTSTKTLRNLIAALDKHAHAIYAMAHCYEMQDMDEQAEPLNQLVNAMDDATMYLEEYKELLEDIEEDEWG